MISDACTLGVYVFFHHSIHTIHWCARIDGINGESLWDVAVYFSFAVKQLLCGSLLPGHHTLELFKGMMKIQSKTDWKRLRHWAHIAFGIWRINTSRKNVCFWPIAASYLLQKWRNWLLERRRPSLNEKYGGSTSSVRYVKSIFFLRGTWTLRILFSFFR